MDALTKLCAKLDYHIARARLWKRAAKVNRGNSEAWKENSQAWKARADRLLELLRRSKDSLDMVTMVAWSDYTAKDIDDFMMLIKEIEKELP